MWASNSEHFHSLLGASANRSRLCQLSGSLGSDCSALLCLYHSLGAHILPERKYAIVVERLFVGYFLVDSWIVLVSPSLGIDVRTGSNRFDTDSQRQWRKKLVSKALKLAEGHRVQDHAPLDSVPP